ncbi:HAD family hydrolase [Falsirhodobacter deserti]|uniref:HAD family hydrolase n=1 Tax=Falsirhodobacter deserti TaxID=1365611 RepID=UPI000FE2DB65|nr:HAD family hydrolase [Falsirhodobacter deserti]
MKPADASLADRLRDRRLVIFDVDGTLYDQSRLRRAMAMRLLSHIALSGRVSTLKALKAYRHAREATADAESADFESEALAAAARAGRMDPARARELVNDWMQQRPLPLLGRCRYDGVAELFARLRAQGTVIGVLSDYPAEAKLKAMGLEADAIAFAGGPGVPLQKPHPDGLHHLMKVTNALPAETILIGDRDERDGEAARRAGIDVLIRADRPAGPDAFGSFASFGALA